MIELEERPIRARGRVDINTKGGGGEVGGGKGGRVK